MSVTKIEKILKALSNKRRLFILLYLERENTSTVLDISKHIKLSFRATSRHLLVLKSAGIVESHQSSLFMWYLVVRPRHPIINLVLSLLGDPTMD